MSHWRSPAWMTNSSISGKNWADKNLLMPRWNSSLVSSHTSKDFQSHWPVCFSVARINGTAEVKNVRLHLRQLWQELGCENASAMVLCIYVYINSEIHQTSKKIQPNETNKMMSASCCCILPSKSKVALIPSVSFASCDNFDVAIWGRSRHNAQLIFPAHGKGHANMEASRKITSFGYITLKHYKPFLL